MKDRIILASVMRTRIIIFLMLLAFMLTLGAVGEVVAQGASECGRIIAEIAPGSAPFGTHLGQAIQNQCVDAGR